MTNIIEISFTEHYYYIAITTTTLTFLSFIPTLIKHSIGYPVVTLGFGFKSYVGYRMRLRKQKDVQKENDFYMQLLQQALPPEQQTSLSSSSSSIQQPEKTKGKCMGEVLLSRSEFSIGSCSNKRIIITLQYNIPIFKGRRKPKIPDW